MTKKPRKKLEYLENEKSFKYSLILLKPTRRIRERKSKGTKK